MLAQMSRFEPQDIVFVADASYYDEAGIPFGDWIQLGGLRFRCPTRERYQEFRKIVVDEELFIELQAQCGGHLSMFRRMLLESLPALEDRLVDYLSGFAERGELEAVLTWCNMPSLRAALDRLGGIPLIHNEIGPLRSPLYRETFYFDFSGVNGHTSPTSWDMDFVRSQMGRAKLLEIDRLRGLLVADTARVDAMAQVSPQFRAGVALQVEDDSNAIAYADGWTSLDLLYDVMGRVGPDASLVRSHPSARFVYRGGLGIRDDSADALEFLGKVQEVVSINSSLLVEAALWGRRFEAKGDTPVRFLAPIVEGPNDESDWAKLAFNTFFISYLVPGELLFDPDYYRWRLASPSLAECYERHLGLLQSGEKLAITALPAAGAQPTGGLIRLPPVWTATLGLERRLLEATQRLKDAEHEAKRREEDLRSSLTTALQEASGWRHEAEENWNNLEWFKSELTRYQGDLGERAGELEAVRIKLGDVELQLAAYARLGELAESLWSTIGGENPRMGLGDDDVVSRPRGPESISEWMEAARLKLELADRELSEFARLRDALYELHSVADGTEQRDSSGAVSLGDGVLPSEVSMAAAVDLAYPTLRDDSAPDGASNALLRRLDALSARVSQLVLSNARDLRFASAAPGRNPVVAEPMQVVEAIRQSMEQLRSRLREADARIVLADAARNELIDDARFAQDILRGLVASEKLEVAVGTSDYAQAAQAEFARMQAGLAEAEAHLAKLRHWPGALLYKMKRVFDRGKG